MFLLSSIVQFGDSQPKDHPMHRFPPLPEQTRAIGKPVPLPSLPWLEITLFGLIAAVLALS